MQMTLITDQKSVTGRIVYVGRAQNHGMPWGELFFRGQKLVVLIFGHCTRKVTMYIRSDTMIGQLHIPKKVLLRGCWEFILHGESLHQNHNGIIYIDSIKPLFSVINTVQLDKYFD